MESTYKIVELVGSSPESWEKAAEVALKEARKSLRDLRIAEVDALDIHIDDNGEIQGEVTSTIATSDGAELFEEGRYYAIVSGADADQQIVGVIVVEHDNPDSLGGGTARETGGFIVER